MSNSLISRRNALIGAVTGGAALTASAALAATLNCGTGDPERDTHDLLHYIPDQVKGPCGGLPDGVIETGIISKIREGKETQTDLSEWIQAALDGCNGLLHIPAGLYCFDKTLNIVDRVLLIGEGAVNRGFCELFYRGNAIAMDIGYPKPGNDHNTNGTRLYNFALRGNADAVGGIYFHNLQGASMSNIYVRMFTKYVPKGDDNTDVAAARYGYGLSCYGSLGCYFEGVDLSQNRIGLVIREQGVNSAKGRNGSTTTCEFRSCIFDKNAHYGAYISSLEGASFYNCIFQNNQGAGLIISSGCVVNVGFFYCWFESNCSDQQMAGTPDAAERFAHLIVNGTGESLSTNRPNTPRGIQFFGLTLGTGAGPGLGTFIIYCEHARVTIDVTGDLGAEFFKIGPGVRPSSDAHANEIVRFQIVD